MTQGLVIKFILMFSSYAYIGVFILLILSGCGFPLPEEVTLLAAGFLTSQVIAHFIPMFIFCLLGVFISDMVPYFFGYFYGTKIFRMEYFKNIINPRKIRKISRFFGLYGYKRVFILRPIFLGIRPFIMLFAGVSGLRLRTFLPYQIIGEVIGVLFWMSMGRLFAKNLAAVSVFFYHSRNILLIVFASLAVLYLLNRYIFKVRLKTLFLIKILTFAFTAAFLALLGYWIFVYRNKIMRFLKSKPVFSMVRPVKNSASAPVPRIVTAEDGEDGHPSTEAAAFAKEGKVMPQPGEEKK